MIDLNPTDYQRAVLTFRDNCNILQAGGRGSGKSHGMCLHILAHCEELGFHARPLVIREQWIALIELQSKLYEMCLSAYGPDTVRNKADGTITLPNGAIVSFTNLLDEQSYHKIQGRSFTGLFGDEVGAYAPHAWGLLQRVRSNLRAPTGLATTIHLTANPLGAMHHTLYKNFISKSPPWHPFVAQDGDRWIWTSSNYKLNPHIDADRYLRQLKASANGDVALEDAWIDGAWGAIGGNMFSHFDPQYHVIPEGVQLGPCNWLVGGDFGQSAPSTAILLALVKTEHSVLPRGSIVAVAEVDTADPSDLSRSDGTTVQGFAEMVLEMCASHGIKTPEMVTDDMRGLNVGETVIEIYRNAGIQASRPAKKNRVATWALINTLLEEAKYRERPGLFISQKCKHLLETIPEAPRNPNRREDLDPKWAVDHWLDGLGYGVVELWDSLSYGSGRYYGGY